MILIFRLLAVALLLLLVQELFRRAGKWVAWAVFFGLPLALTPYWSAIGRAGDYSEGALFPWIKLCSLQIGACWLTALRFTSLGNLRWARGVLFLMLPLNILEAVTQDAFGGHAAHYLLGLSGILLIVSVPHPLRAIQIDAGNRFRDLQYAGMTRTWIAGYTLWNWAFVYLNFPIVAGHQLAVLASSFVVGMVAPSRWLQARTFTLAADLLALATFPSVVIPFTDTTHWASPARENISAGACLAIVVAYAVGFFMRRRTRPN